MPQADLNLRELVLVINARAFQLKGISAQMDAEEPDEKAVRNVARRYRELRDAVSLMGANGGKLHTELAKQGISSVDDVPEYETPPA